MPRLLDRALGRPQPVVLHRNDPVHPPANFPWDTTFYQPRVPAEEAPQPVPSSAFAGVGRDPGHSPTPLTRFSTLAIADWLSVAAWPFSLVHTPGALVLDMPTGQFNPIRERTVINSPGQTTLSDLTAVDPSSYVTAPNLAKIA